MGQLLDRPTEEDAHIRRRLETEPVVWLSTVTAAGAPRSVPVWFLWDDPRVHVFSGAGTQKLRNIAANPRVWLTLDSGDGGKDVVLLEGTAVVLPATEASAAGNTRFLEKYSARMSQTPEAWSADFPVPIVITVHRLVAWSKPPTGQRYRVAP